MLHVQEVFYEIQYEYLLETVERMEVEICPSLFWALVSPLQAKMTWTVVGQANVRLNGDSEVLQKKKLISRCEILNFGKSTRSSEAFKAALWLQSVLIILGVLGLPMGPKGLLGAPRGS